MNDAQPEPSPPTVSDKLAVVEQPISTVIQTMVVGMLAMCRGLPPEIVLTTIAWHTGNLAGNAVQGQLEMVLNARKAFLEAFADGLQKAELHQTPPSPKPNRRQ